MKKPFIDELVDFCDTRGYQMLAVGIDRNIVDITLEVKEKEDIDDLQMKFEGLR